MKDADTILRELIAVTYGHAPHLDAEQVWANALSWYRNEDAAPAWADAQNAAPEPMTERDQFDLARWHKRLGELADAYYETGRGALGRLLYATEALGFFSYLISYQVQFRECRPLWIDDEFYRKFLDHSRTFAGACLELDLPVCHEAEKRRQAAMNESRLTPEIRVLPGEQRERKGFWIPSLLLREVHATCGFVSQSLDAEAKSKVAMILSQQMKEMHDIGSKGFGVEVESKFPSAAFDIDEAHKCLALGRQTAAVYHMMRTLEVALLAVQKCLGVPGAGNSNWGAILKSIKAVIDSRGNSWSEKARFSEIYALLDSVKSAWRNSTMHVERAYTEEEAKAIRTTVHNFIAAVASRTDEDGLPLA